MQRPSQMPGMSSPGPSGVTLCPEQSEISFETNDHTCSYPNSFSQILTSPKTHLVKPRVPEKDPSLTGVLYCLTPGTSRPGIASMPHPDSAL